MHLTTHKAKELQEQLILIYKFIHQDRMTNSFYFQGLESKDSPGELINKINQLENPEEILKMCIVEMEELKEDKKLKKEAFNDIIENYDISFLNRKYSIKKAQDFDKLDFKQLLCLL